MKLILKEDMGKLGEAGDVVEVKNGYARNFLLPQGLAEVSTPEKIEMMQKEKEKKRAELEKMGAQIQMLAEKLEHTSCTVTVKSGEDDKLFGTVTNADIAKKLKEEGIVVDKKSIVLEEPIKKLGIYSVSVKLSSDITATFKLWVVKE